MFAAAAAPGAHKEAIERALDGLNFATFVLESVAANGCIGGGGNNCDLKVGLVEYFIWTSV